ncbi:hypothetical protein BJY04DRAFT_221453 [Aspergillus karnatakaensis]|uniref:uncharacterized protein n=1 Tax=Aspergillus karnatakaensis TaxID=1810916 RepID=UPI003CCCB536
MEKFPNDPIFTQLVGLRDSVEGVLIHDDYGIDATAEDILHDIVALRNDLRRELPADWFDARGLLKPDAGRIATISLSGYYFLVGFFAIAALGGTCVVLPTTHAASAPQPDEALRVMRMADAVYLLTEPNADREVAILKESAPDIHTIPIVRKAQYQSRTDTAIFEVNECLIIEPESPAIVIATSGTSSGEPKCVLVPRRAFFFDSDSESESDSEADESDRVFLAYRSVHWMGGCCGLLGRFLNGMKIHWPLRRREPAMFWDIFKTGTVTDISFPPSLFKSLQEYYYSSIRTLPDSEHEAFVAGARKLQNALVSGSTMDPATAQFWIELTGMNLQCAYGSTELGSTFQTDSDAPYLDRCIGSPHADVEVKLSDGDEGELFVKSPRMFIRYLKNEPATNNAFDEDGFYKTGDLVRRVGENYFFEGRANVDFIHHFYLKISIPELESHLLALPYIHEAYILPVLDRESRGLAAALVRLKPGHTSTSINLHRIRSDLSTLSSRQEYSLPSLLYILQDGEEIPRSTGSDKVLKARALEKFFRIRGYKPPGYAVDGVECIIPDVDAFWLGKEWKNKNIRNGNELVRGHSDSEDRVDVGRGWACAWARAKSLCAKLARWRWAY